MFDLEAALEEFTRWGTGSKTIAGISHDGDPIRAEEAMNRARLEASIKAALGQSLETAA